MKLNALKSTVQFAVPTLAAALAVGGADAPEQRPPMRTDQWWWSYLRPKAARRARPPMPCCRVIPAPRPWPASR